MDGFNEKKWFVYVGDHHEGPISLAEIQSKMGQGQVSRGSYVWCEGMTDWKVMTEVPAFESLVSGPPAVSAMPPGLGSEPPSAPVSSGEPSMGLQNPEDDGAVAVSAEPSLSPTEIHVPEMESSAASPAAEEAPEDPKARKKREKAEAKAAKAAEKAEKSAEKAAAKAATSVSKTREKDAKHTGIGTEGAVSRGGERLIPRLIRGTLVMIVIGAAGAAWQLGYLDPVLDSPAVKAGVQTARDLTQPYVIQAIEKVPALANLLSPISRLDDVSPEDYDELKEAALGEAVGIALSRLDPASAKFYLASNREDGTTFEVHVDGVAGTLLHQLSFQKVVRATFAHRLAATPVVLGDDGKPVSRGEYIVSVFEPKGTKPLAKKTFFLGGNKDQAYASRLKEFHERYAKIAKDELLEVGQLTATLQLQLNETVNSYAKLSKGKAIKVQQKLWNGAHTKWMQIDGQLAQKFTKLTPESLQKDYFYGVLYDHLLKTSQALQKLHGLHHAHFSGTSDPTALEIQLGEALSGAQNELAALKTKLEAAEKLPATANGMPRRDGL